MPADPLQPFFKQQAVDDIREYASLGIKGLKLHPFMDFGGNPINSRELIFPRRRASFTR